MSASRLMTIEILGGSHSRSVIGLGKGYSCKYSYKSNERCEDAHGSGGMVTRSLQLFQLDSSCVYPTPVA